MIVHIITGLLGGGAEHTLYRLLSARPLETHVISMTDEGVFGPRLRALGIPVMCLGMRVGAIPSPFVVLRLSRILRQLRPSLVQTWMYHADLIGGLAGLIVDVPVVWNIRNGHLSATESSRMTRIVVRICAMVSGWLPSCAISCSVRAAEIHQNLGYRCRMRVIPNGIDTSYWQPNSGMSVKIRNTLEVPTDSLLIGHAGRADRQKDHPTLLKAFIAVSKPMRRAHLVLCGQGVVRGQPYFEALPTDLECDDRVHVLGPRNDLQEIFPALDLFVLSSSYGEAFPNVVAEAMACGVPCVVTDVGDAAEIVGDTGWVVPIRDPIALGKAMREAATLSHEERIERGLAARQRIENMFTFGRMVDAYRNLWREVSGKEVTPCVD